ncbi:MAG: MerR family transcriptional regulator [Bryobacteraceae bacterium]
MEDLAVNPVVEAEIPDKLCFRIGEVAKLAGVKPHVLRFWEAEFRGLGPKKSGTGHRVYRRKDVAFVLEIKRLLYEKRFTIEGARKHLESQANRHASPVPNGRKQGELFTVPVAFSEVRRELKELAELLRDPPGNEAIPAAKKAG